MGRAAWRCLCGRASRSSGRSGQSAATVYRTALAALLLTLANPPAAASALDPEALAGDLLLLEGAEAAELSALAPEAQRVLGFLVERRQPGRLELEQSPHGAALLWIGEPEQRLELAPGMARLMAGLADLAERQRLARERPVSSQQLTAAFAAHPEVVSALVEPTWSQPPLGDARSGGPSWFELGGVALLDDGAPGAPRPLLVQLPDSVQRLARRLHALGPDRDAIAALRREQPLGFLGVDPNGLLAAWLERSAGRAPDDPRTPRSGRLILGTLLENTASSYMYDRRALLARLATEGLPAGRWLGPWHTHPGLPSGAPPSPDDHEVARLRGRFLTIVLGRQGYQLYDLRRDAGAAAPVLTAEPEGWRQRLDAALARAAASSGAR